MTAVFINAADHKPKCSKNVTHYDALYLDSGWREVYNIGEVKSWLMLTLAHHACHCIPA